MKHAAVILSAIAAWTGTVAASQAAEPRTRVAGCSAGSCLIVSGRRDSAIAPVSINGQAVTVEGGRNWRVRVPVETIRGWSAPLARSIIVTVGAGAERRDFDARLPIGLLGQPQDLAFLEISLK